MKRRPCPGVYGLQVEVEQFGREESQPSAADGQFSRRHRRRKREEEPLLNCLSLSVWGFGLLVEFLRVAPRQGKALTKAFLGSFANSASRMEVPAAVVPRPLTKSFLAFFSPSLPPNRHTRGARSSSSSSPPPPSFSRSCLLLYFLLSSEILVKAFILTCRRRFFKSVLLADFFLAPCPPTISAAHSSSPSPDTHMRAVYPQHLQVPHSFVCLLWLEWYV